MNLGVLRFGVALLAVSAHAIGGDPGVPFVENKRQWPAEFRFAAEIKGAKLFTSDKRLYFVQMTQEPAAEKGPQKLKTAFSEDGHLHRGYNALTTFEIVFANSLTPRIIGGNQLPTLYNYYLGNDPTSWGVGAHSFSDIVYEDLYDGIDLRLYSDGDLLKSDWIVRPCADAREINLVYNGMDDILLTDGRLHVTTCLGTVVEEQPFAYQVIDGKQKQVVCTYKLTGNSLTFDFPEGYDENYELIIDPILIFSSYSGSTADNWGNTATPDSRGNLYSGGMVSNLLGSKGFPVTAGAYQQLHQGGEWDVGILKYDSVGATLLYATYLGGVGVETPQSLVVNHQDQLLILGATGSADFPGATPGSFKGGASISPINGINYFTGTDIFIARLSPNGGQLLSATYLGGTANDAINFVSGQIGVLGKVESPLGRNYGDQLRGDITIDDDDNVYIASSTRSNDFPIVNADPGAAFHGGTHDAVVVKLTPDLSSLIWSRLVGGSLTDVAYSIKIGKDDRIYVGGGTTSTDLAGMTGMIQVAPGNTDGWIIELSTDGTQILNGTYIGTPQYDQVYFIDISTEGDVLAFGQTRGHYPIQPLGKVYSQQGGGQFLHKLDASLSTTEFSTVFGNSQIGTPNPNISPTAFLVNDCDNIYMAGWGGQINAPNYFQGLPTNYVGGNTTNLPVTPDAYQSTTVMGNDFYMMVLTGSAELAYATYLGGTTSLTHVDGGTSRFDKRGIVYHAVCAGCGGFSDFPAVNVPPSRSTNKSARCNNAAFKFDLSSLRARIRTNNVELSAPGANRVCMPDAIVFENKSVGGERFEWDLGDGTQVTKFQHDTVTHFYKTPGTYVVKLTSIDLSTCIGVDSTVAIVTVTKPQMSAGSDQEICFGTSTRIEASGAVSYAWTGELSGFASTEASPLIAPEESDRYFVKMTDAGGCVIRDTVAVRVIGDMELSYEIEVISDCLDRPSLKFRNATELEEDENTVFFFGDGQQTSDAEGIHNYENDNIYRVGVVGMKEHCLYETGEDVIIATLRVPNVITPEDSQALNDTFKVLLQDIFKDHFSISLLVFDKWGVEVYRNEAYNGDWAARGLPAGVYYYELKTTGYPTCKGWLEVIK